MFKDCYNLEYINLKNFIENSSSYLYGVFNDVPDNVVVCLNNNSKEIINQIKNKNCYTIDCSDNWIIYKKNKVNKTGICFDINNEDILFKYEYNSKYYEDCIDRNLINHNDNIKICECNSSICLSCIKISLNENLCIKCNKGYYELENDNYIDGYVKCYKDPLGYYLDINIYKKCYYTCKQCDIKGNNITHNCIKCNDKYKYGINTNNYFNCYDNCTYYFFVDNEDNHICTNNQSCPNEYPILLLEHLIYPLL